MKTITLEQLLEAGCHFGHQVTRSNPKAREFVFESRDNIQIIDLGKTKEGLEEAAQFLLETAKNPESTLLVVGTKRQAVPILEEILKEMSPIVRKSIFTVTKRWMGGTLTNSAAISKNYDKLNEFSTMLTSDEWKQKYTKRELTLFGKDKEKLQAFYGGIQDMKRLPTALFVIDTHTEDLAVREANRMGIPVAGIVDTNANPDVVDYVIPANDDAVGSLKLLIGYMLDAWVEGKTSKEMKDEKGEMKKETKEEVKEAAKREEPAKEEKKVAKKSSKKEKTA